MNNNRIVFVAAGIVMIALIGGGLWSYSARRPARHILDLTPLPNPNSGPRQDPYELNRQGLQAIQPEPGQ